MTRSELAAIFGMTPEAAVAFLRDKKLFATWDYREIFGAAHRRTFTVAKVMKLDLLTEIHASLVQAQRDGKGFDEWRRQLRPTLARHGWLGTTEVFNPRTGEFKTIKVNARRLHTIYETNIRSAYAHGRYLHQMASPTLDMWMYVSALLPTTRPQHAAMHGRVYPRSHPFWDAHYPPNGYNCHCHVRAYSSAQLARRGITPSTEYEPFADPGFTHRPAEGIEAAWDRKILSAPDALKPLAKQEKQISDLYDTAFDADADLAQVFMRHKPAMVLDPNARINNKAAYDLTNRLIIFRSIPDLPTLRHESAHALDHARDFVSAAMLPTLEKDVASWQQTHGSRDEIKAILTSNPYDDDFYMHDLFYLSSEGWVGYPTREKSYFTDRNKHAEAFAVMMEAYLSGTKLDIIQTYFPTTYEEFMKILATLKESP